MMKPRRRFRFKYGKWFISGGWVVDNIEERVSRKIIQDLKDLADGRPQISEDDIISDVRSKLRDPAIRSIVINKTREGSRLFQLRGVRYGRSKQRRGAGN